MRRRLLALLFSFVLLVAGALGACRREPNGALAARPDDAGASAASTAPSTAPSSSTAPSPPSSSPSANTCVIEPKGGVAIPSSSRATDVRIAGTGTKALVTWYEVTKPSDQGPGVLASIGHVLDAPRASLGPRLELDVSDVGDEPMSGAAPVALGPDLFAVTCDYLAPSGHYRCTKTTPGAKPTRLFEFGGISTGGPLHPGLGVVAKGDDVVVFVPAAGATDLHVFSARVSSKKKTYPFAIHLDADPSAPHADALSAVLSGDDEATVVYRINGVVRARRAGFDQAWRGKSVDLSAKGALVGAPVAASDGPRVVALFSQRARASDPWKLVMARWSPGAEPERAELITGDAQAQGPGIAPAGPPGCFLVSWVEGTGKATRPRVARACEGRITPSSVVDVSTSGVEGGRAILAADPAQPTDAFVVWQEIPPGKAAELRVGRIACRSIAFTAPSAGGRVPAP
jgi:hypothetical protein